MTNRYIRASCPALLFTLVAGTASAPAQQDSPAMDSQSGGVIQRFRDAHGDFIRRAYFIPLVTLTGLWLPEAQIASEPGDFDMWEVELDATIPLPVERDSFLILGLETGIRDVKFTDVQTVADETLYRIGPKLGFGKYFTEDLVVQAYWQPSIYSDFDGSLQSEDYRLHYGTALAVYRQNDNLFWKLGFKITDAIDTGVVPLAGLMWHIDDNWMLDILAPRHAQLRYRADEKWTFSGGFRIRGDEYHVRGPASIGEPQHDVHVQEVLLQLTSEYRFTENLSGQLTVGTTVAGEWDWGYGNGQPHFDGTLEPGLFLACGLGWRF